ncbi:galactose-1-phosphate uridylyltransferase [Wukongibacter sp. M2B1]|uniref:galactose-1-phosphate uridylyltransferase n=1 Tax=Wukongibacter sp. M2B1 TaxID=3088895 RepID=UPI003D7A522F
MTQIRQDLFTGNMVIMASGRVRRPSDFRNIEKKKDVLEIREDCVFCPGNEEEVPAEVERIEREGLWRVRSVPNKYPILDNNCKDECMYDLHSCIKGGGFHEVVIDTYRHNGNFFNMDIQEFFDYLSILESRYNSLKNKENVEYITIFKNYLREAGASLEHPHSQILTIPLIPPNIAKEIDKAKIFFDENGICLHKYVMDYERRMDKRIIHESGSFMVMAPYASLYSNEVVIIYKYDKRFENISIDEIEELSMILNKLFTRMYNFLGDFPFNMYFHTDPINIEKSNFYRWHIHITPKKGTMGGFETSTGICVNSIRPEEVASALRWL